MADRLRQWLDEVRALEADPKSAATVAALRTALQKRPGHVVAAAARHASEHGLALLGPDLVRAYLRLAEGGVKADPGCTGKLAAVEALSALDDRDDEAFLHAVTLRQMEKSWGPPVDTAANLRGAALMGLVGTGEPGTPERIAAMLADPEPRSRAAAARCAVGWGDAVLARALLVLRVAAGEDHPEVLAECFDGLIRTGATDRVEAHLSPGDPQAEAAALALGSAKVASAIPALIRWVEETVDRSSRHVGWVAIGLTRTAEALDYLLAKLEDGPRDGAAALQALAVFRGDPVARARIVDAARAADLDPGE